MVAGPSSGEPQHELTPIARVLQRRSSVQDAEGGAAQSGTAADADADAILVLLEKMCKPEPAYMVGSGRTAETVVKGRLDQLVQFNHGAGFVQTNGRRIHPAEVAIRWGAENDMKKIEAAVQAFMQVDIGEFSRILKENHNDTIISNLFHTVCALKAAFFKYAVIKYGELMTDESEKRVILALSLLSTPVLNNFHPRIGRIPALMHPSSLIHSNIVSKHTAISKYIMQHDLYAELHADAEPSNQYMFIRRPSSGEGIPDMMQIKNVPSHVYDHFTKERKTGLTKSPWVWWYASRCWLKFFSDMRNKNDYFALEPRRCVLDSTNGITLRTGLVQLKDFLHPEADRGDNGAIKTAQNIHLPYVLRERILFDETTVLQ